MSLEIGTTATIEYKVEDKDLAKNLGISSEDNFPAVFATARLTALMEATAAKVLIFNLFRLFFIKYSKFFEDFKL